MSRSRSSVGIRYFSRVGFSIHTTVHMPWDCHVPFSNEGFRSALALFTLLSEEEVKSYASALGVKMSVRWFWLPGCPLFQWVKPLRRLVSG
jgi:hypothetical protein